uniref:Zinc finger CCHC domain-containing protein 7 n=1 Tax=Acanthochromis polyacanthus TaxID=80966 RepID=A0A3Q1FHJ8_9TELE
MYCAYQDREELEDDLYQEDEGDSDGSEADSELEFRLYSQLHYSSNPGELEEQEDGEEKEPDREHQDSQKQSNDAKELKPEREIEPPSPIYSKSQQHLKKKKGEKQDKQQKKKSDFKKDVESKSESDSSSSSDSSDSDALENWMILGRGKQDGDQSISLNLEGGSDSNKGVSLFLIYNKDKGVRTAVQRVASRYYTGKNVHCRNCNKTGHLSKNCPEPKKVQPCFLCGTPGHVVSECPKKHCNNCGLPGHLYESCSERAYWHKQCHRCSMTGHFFDACPEIWRQYHITVSIFTQSQICQECTQRRMFNGTYPSIPFINHYDTVEDINRRQHRIKLRVKGKSPTEKHKHLFLSSWGGTGESMQKKKKKRRMNKMKQVLFGLPGGHRDGRPDYLCRTVKGAMPGPQSKQQKAKKNPKRRDRNLRKADKQFGAEMYPTDENLFSIKQRKRRRKNQVL